MPAAPMSVTHAARPIDTLATPPMANQLGLSRMASRGLLAATFTAVHRVRRVDQAGGSNTVARFRAYILPTIAENHPQAW
jgi:hypothetical protein